MILNNSIRNPGDGGREGLNGMAGLPGAPGHVKLLFKIFKLQTASDSLEIFAGLHDSGNPRFSLALRTRCSQRIIFLFQMKQWIV